MKKCQKALLTLLPSFLTLAIAIPFASSFAPENNPAGEDTAIYDTNLEHAKLSKPDITNIKRATEGEGEDPEEDVKVEVNKVILHYYNENNDCGNRAFYIWNTGVDGVEYSDTFNNEDGIVTVSQDGSMMTIVLDFINNPTFKFLNKKQGMWFIIKFKRIDAAHLNWGGQSDDMYLRYEDFADSVSDDHQLEVWATPAAGGGIVILDQENKLHVHGVKLAEFTDWKTIKCTVTDDTTRLWWKLYAYDETYYKIKPKDRGAYQKKYLVKEEVNVTVPSSKTFEIKLKYEIHPNMVYSLESHDPTTDDDSDMAILNKISTVGFTTLYDSAKFHTYYEDKHQQVQDFGMTYTPEATTFKVWSPMSANVTLMIYDNDTSSEYDPDNENADKYKGYHMHYTSGGIWELTVDHDLEKNETLEGKYYNYQVDNVLGTNIAMDPYATSAGTNGVRGFIYDKNDARAVPNGWDELPTKWDGIEGYDITTPQELTVYEVHMMDFTGDDSWNGTKANQGTYNGFVEKGTHVKDHPGVSTGYDHLNELGIKAVQILPMFDSDNDERVDEETGVIKYNWGYNPLNYNVVEGAYSSDPSDGYARVKEFRNLVLEMSKTEVHTRVIMDVVYNHVSSATGSAFHKLMPRYYFRYHGAQTYNTQTKQYSPDPQAGELYDGSGCHNEVASERRMMRKYIVDSLCMWARDYKVKGFRFDLMGLLDFKTLNKAREELYKIDPDIYIYGEGWSSVEGYHGDGTLSYDMSHPTEAPTSEAMTGKPSTNYSCSTWQVYHNCNNFDAGNYCYLGCFNDFYRNAVRGENDQGWGSDSHLPGSGLVQADNAWVWKKVSDDPEEWEKDYLRSWRTAQGLWGINDDQQGFFPEQTVDYASCHDNWTVRDQLYNTMHGNAPATAEELLRASLQTHAMTFAANCTAFILGGEELLRTKELKHHIVEKTHEYIIDEAESVTPDSYEWMHGHALSHNSYNSSIECNSFKWGNKIQIDVDSTSVTDAVYGYNQKFKQLVRMHGNYEFKRGSSNARDYNSFMRITTKNNIVDNVTWGGDGTLGYAIQVNETFIFCSVNNKSAGNAYANANCGAGGQWVSLFEYGVNGYYSSNNIVGFEADNPNGIHIYNAKGIR